jgi:bacterioferritin-associated ferredoxin
MVESLREEQGPRRRAAQAQPTPSLAPAPARATATHPVLALQRAAGNRAVVAAMDRRAPSSSRAAAPPKAPGVERRSDDREQKAEGADEQLLPERVRASAGAATPPEGNDPGRPDGRAAIQGRGTREGRRLVATLHQAQQYAGNRVAQRLVAAGQSRPAQIQRSCACGGTCDKCAKSDALVVRAHAAHGAPAAAAKTSPPTDDIAPVESRGGPLDVGVRAFMEARFGASFGHVRVHTDERAAASARTIGADAYTFGRDVYFAAGKYAPSSRAGRLLIAHELSHTLQQGASGDGAIAPRPAEMVVGPADDPLEREADRAAVAVVDGAPGTAIQLSGGAAPMIRRGIVGDVWDATGGAVIRKGEEILDDIKEWAVSKIEEYAPGLLKLLRGDLTGFLRDKIEAGLDALTGGLVSQIRKKGLFGALGDLAGGIGKAVGRLGGDACHGIAGAIGAVLQLVETIGGAGLSALKKAADFVGGLLEGFWTKLGAPAWNAIKGVASTAWAWIEDKAAWIWKALAPVRNTLGRAWRWLKKMFGLAWDGAGDILGWLKDKALAAWEKVKEVIQPVLKPLKIVGAALLLLSPLGPVLVVWKGAPLLWDALKWLANNWKKLDIVVRARTFLTEQVFPAILTGVDMARALLDAALGWLGERAAELVGALGQLAEALGLSPVLGALRGAVEFLAEEAGKLAAWVKKGFGKLVEGAKSALHAIGEFVKPVLIVLLKLGLVIANPFLLPIFLAGAAWKLTPDCLKPPIIDFILDLLIGAVRALPNFARFGEAWPKVKEGILKTLVETRRGSVERKVAISNRIADMIAGGTLEGFGNLFAAAKLAPSLFVGQLEEELIGMNLTEPLPFERTERPALALGPGPGVGSAAQTDLDVLTRARLTDADVGVTQVAPLELDPALLASLPLQRDGAVEFGRSNDPSRSLDAVRAELMGGPAEGQEAAGGAAPARAMSTDEQLDLMIAQQPAMGCAKEKPAEGPARAPDIPEHLKIGPLTQSQRARYLWAQMKKGIGQWYDCHKTAIIASVAAALVVFVVAAILTDGALIEALPAIMEIVGAIMIGVAIVRVTAYIAEYVVKAATGDVAGAAKALARGLAVGAVELIFALLFNLDKVIKSLRGGLKGTLEGIERAATRFATNTVKNVEKVGQLAVKGGRATVRNLERAGAFFVRNGKIVFEGLERGFARGSKSLGELAERLWAKVRFRRFKLVRSGRWLQLWGEINPWVLLASGDIEQVTTSGGARAEIGDALEVAGRRKPGFLVGVVDTLPSTAVQDLKALSRAERRRLYQQLAGSTPQEARNLLLAASATGRNAKELRDAMTAAGLVAKAGEDAHHIIPSTHRLADEARTILDGAGISINQAKNGVFLTEALHAGLHTKGYMAKVTELLKAAKPSDVPRVLDDIRAALAKGGLAELMKL